MDTRRWYIIANYLHWTEPDPFDTQDYLNILEYLERKVHV